MHQLRCYAASLSIRLQIDIKIWIAVEGGLSHRLFNDVCHLKEATFALAETGIHYLIGCIYDARHIATLPDGIKGKLQALELLIVRLEELQILRLKEVETLPIEMQTLREREGILDRQTHIRHTQLSLHGSIDKLNSPMNNPLRMEP